MPDPEYMVRIPAEVLKQAKIAAIEANMHLSEVVRQLIELWLAGKVKLPKTK